MNRLPNNDVTEVFDIYGKISLDSKEAVKNIEVFNEKGKQTAKNLDSTFKQLEESFNKMNLSNEVEIDAVHAKQQIQEFKKSASDMIKDLKLDSVIAVDVKEDSIKQLERLKRQLHLLKTKIELGDTSVKTGYSAQHKRVQGTMSNIRETLPATQTPTVEQRFLSEIARALFLGAPNVSENNAKQDTVENKAGSNTIAIGDNSLSHFVVFSEKLGGIFDKLQQVFQKVNEVAEKVINSEIASGITKMVNALRDSLNKLTRIDAKVDKIVRYTNHSQIVNTPREHIMSSSAASNAPPVGTEGVSGGELATLLAAQSALGNSSGYGTGYYRSRGTSGYNLNQSQAIEQAMQRRFLEYAQKMTPQNVLPKVEQSLNTGSAAVPYFLDAKNLMQVQSAFGMIESGATNARKQLAQLGFGRTKQEIKAVEAQMHSLANVRMDDLKDNIKITENALKDMKKSARTGDYVKEIAKANEALKRYKSELETINVAKKAGEVEGYKVGKFGGKDVLIKEYKSIFDKVGGAMIQSVNRDLARSLNMTYNSLDKNAIKIVGDQGTKALNKAKVNALATAFQTLGMQMQMVAPIIGALTAGVVALGAKADEASSSFEAKTLVYDKDPTGNGEDMETYKRMITDVAVTTGASQGDVSGTMSTMYNTMGLRGQKLKESAEYGENFKGAWDGVEAVEAYQTIQKISNEMGVDDRTSANMLAQAMTKHHGNMKAAKKDILENQKLWRASAKEQYDGMEAYEKMTEGSMNAFQKMTRAMGEVGSAITEIWYALDPYISKIADKIYEITKAFKIWMREHETATKWIATLGALATGLTALSAILLPLMGFLLINRNLFQALGQSLGLMGKGMAIVNPQARMLLDSMQLLKSGLLGMPRLMRSFVPGIFSLFRGLPIMIASAIGQFIRLNPILTAIGVVFLLVSKNFDKYKESLASIWDSLKRIASSILTAFGGEGASTAEKFDSILQKISDVAAKVLVPAFEALATALEWVANVMESGGGTIVASILKWSLFATVLGGLTQSLGKTKDAVKGLFSPLQKVIGLFAKLTPFFGLGGGSIDINENRNTRNDGTAQQNSQNRKESNVNTSRINAANIYINGANVNVDGFEGEDDGPLELIREKIEEQQESTENESNGGKVIVRGSPVFVQGRRAGDVPDNDRGPMVDGPSDNGGPNRNDRGGNPSDIRPPRVDTGNQDAAPRKWYQKLMAGFTKYGGKLGKGISKVFGRVMRAVASGLLRMVPVIGTAIFVLFDVLPIVIDLLGPLVPTVIKYAKKAAKGFVNGIKGMLSGARRILGVIGRFFTRIFKGIYKTVSKWIGKAKSFFARNMRRIREITTNVLSAIAEFFVEKFKAIYDTVVKWLSNAWDFIKKVFGEIRDFITKTLKKVAKIVSDKFKESYESAKKWLGKLWDKVVGVFTDIGDFFTGIANKANQWGADIILGIWEGMKDKATTMLGWITKLGESIAELFKKAMGIQSPSRVMRAIAKWIPIGVGLGINDGAKDVKKATRGMSDTIVRSFKPKLTTDDIMNGIVKSKQVGIRNANLSMANLSSSLPIQGMESRFKGGDVNVDKVYLNVNNHTERAARGFEQTTRKQLDREVRRKMR